MRRITRGTWRSSLACALALSCALLISWPGELSARGGGGFSRGGGGGGFSRGGGGFSRGGAARGGSIGGYDRSRAGSGAYSRSSYPGGGGTSDRSSWGGRTSGSYGTPGETRSRDGSFETRRGETVDWDSTVTRTEGGFDRETSWESTSGASGSGSSSVRVEDGQVQSRSRSQHVENAQGETMNRQVQSEREDGWVERESSVKTSTGIDAESEGYIKKTDDGFIAQGAVWGKDGAAAGTIVKDGDDVYARGAATDGDDVTWGRAHCNDGKCTGGRVTADIDDYDYDPYYYYPYYYGWYSCPYGSVQSWHGAYGTPVYGCSNVTVVHTTIALGSSSTSTSGSGSSGSAPREAQVTSAPVLMYEIDPSTVVYATTYEPQGVYALKQGERFFWAPGPAEASGEAKAWIVAAGAMPQPTANATVITYTIGPRIVYLTNERPAPGFFAEPSDQLFAWIPGVREPDDDERSAIRTAVTAQRAGGQAALDREARKLEKGREPPPATPPS